MGGLAMSCGAFQGRDKSASALLEVIKELRDAPVEVIDPITGAFKTLDYLFIPEIHAEVLLPFLIEYKSHLVAQIGDDDWAREANAEVRAGTVTGGRREGRGWRLYCTVDLIKACETSVLEHQPVLICFA